MSLSWAFRSISRKCREPISLRFFPLSVCRLESLSVRYSPKTLARAAYQPFADPPRRRSPEYRRLASSFDLPFLHSMISSASLRTFGLRSQRVLVRIAIEWCGIIPSMKSTSSTVSCDRTSEGPQPLQPPNRHRSPCWLWYWGTCPA